MMALNLDYHSIREPLGTIGHKKGAAGTVGTKRRENPSHGKEGETNHTCRKHSSRKEMAVNLYAIRPVSL
jgi:hypothetical protein